MNKCENFYNILKIIRGEEEPENIARLLKYSFDKEDVDMIIEVFDREINIQPNRVLYMITELLRHDSFNDFDDIYDWLFELFVRSDDYIFIVSETIAFIIRQNNYMIPKEIADRIDRLSRKYKLEILRVIILDMNNVYAPLNQKIKRVIFIYDIMFALPIEDIFKDNNIFKEDIFYGWFIDVGDMVHIMKNNSLIGMDEYIKHLLGKIEMGIYTDHETVIEDVLFKLIKEELISASENISMYSYTDFMELVETSWYDLDIYKKMAISYYMNMNYVHNIGLDHMIPGDVRKAYSIIYFFFTEVVKDREENSERIIEYNYSINSSYAMDIIDRLCN